MPKEKFNLIELHNWCGWCHEQILATMERYVSFGNACNDCEFRFGHVMDNSAKWSDYTSADAMKDLEFRFMYNHVNHLCVKEDCEFTGTQYGI